MALLAAAQPVTAERSADGVGLDELAARLEAPATPSPDPVVDVEAIHRRVAQLSANLRRLRAPDVAGGFDGYDAWWARMVAPKLEEYVRLRLSVPLWASWGEEDARRHVWRWLRRVRPDLFAVRPPEARAERPPQVVALPRRPPVPDGRARRAARPRARRPARRRRAVARAGPDDSDLADLPGRRRRWAP